MSDTAKYEKGVCVCCEGTWRLRVQFPNVERATKYLSSWKFEVICGRCNTQECGGDYRDNRIVPCLTGRPTR